MQKPNYEIYTVDHLPSDGPFRILSTGGNHSLVLTGSGQLYGSGSNTYCQIGPREQINNRLDAFTLVKTPFNTGLIRMISCGEEHSAFYLATGDLFICGQQQRETFSHVMAGMRIISMSSSFRSTFLIDESGFTYEFGKLRIDPSEDESSYKKSYSMNLTEVDEVVCGKCFAYFFSHVKPWKSKFCRNLFSTFRNSKLVDLDFICKNESL